MLRSFILLFLQRDELCSYELSEHITEFRIWFVRMCYSQPQAVKYIATELGIASSDKPNENKDPGTFESNIDNMIGN